MSLHIFSGQTAAARVFLVPAKTACSPGLWVHTTSLKGAASSSAVVHSVVSFRIGFPSLSTNPSEHCGKLTAMTAPVTDSPAKQGSLNSSDPAGFSMMKCRPARNCLHATWAHTSAIISPMRRVFCHVSGLICRLR